VAHHSDAKKRLKQNETRRLRNKSARTFFRGKVRACREAIASGDSSIAKEKLKEADSAIRIAVRKGVIKPNTGSRYISRLVKQVNALSSPSASSSA
jgi:small subunit ribosomal protein S20